jgi:autotransporter adhesin
MPQASDPGRAMIAMGVSTYQGQQAVAFGFSARLRDARTVIRAGANFDTRGRASGNAGVGVQF